MKAKLLIYFLSITICCFSQEYKLVQNETDTFYKVLIDSFKPNLDYPDGRYKLFQSDSNKLPNMVFYLQNGMVDGSYLELNKDYWKCGTYFNDSLMTFLTAPDDTTFKIGTWKTTHAFYSSFSKSYDNYSTIIDHYKMPFNEKGQFTEKWEFYNGQTARIAIFKKGFGLIKETYWNFETNNVFKETINSGTSNYYQSIVYKNDSIESVWLIQNGIEIVIDLNSVNNWGQHNKCAEVSIYDNDNKTLRLPITTISVDSSKTLNEFSDFKKRIFLKKDNEGNTKVIYPNQIFKKRYKTIEVK
jgi:hypothetical protein